MAIFPHLELEAVVQENDRTRLSATKSFADKSETAAISLVRIDAGEGAGFVDVKGSSFEDWFLDVEYPTDGAKTVTVEVTTDGAPVTKTGTITVISAADDKLLSSDSDLVGHESDILQWIRDGRNTFLDKHRVARDRILSYLDEQKIWDDQGNRLDKDDLTSAEDFAEWAKFETLLIIFEALSNAIDDIFAEKSRRYTVLRNQARNRAAIRLDRNNDGTTDRGATDVRTGFLFRR